MSSFLRGSQNYVWSQTSVLGKGATGAVYQGVNKINGEPVAVKTFNQVSLLRPQEVQIREFEVLKKVNHLNIVKLLAIEEEHDNNRENNRGKKVIVMELCTGGSLFNILDDPENTYGLDEKEFLLVLEHLTAGMKHLRDNNLVHRDLKPGNIMKFICEDGTAVYKLTDFGAARELQEGQQFQSLYGTEEYLHPDMYERAVLRKDANKQFGATIDLWSIGVTLYHVATGNLPFRPYGGRKNKETMYYITTKKASGVISGIQLKENGAIEWRTELPNNCHLSAGLKKTVTPLLAGLLEADSRKIWTFEKFFNEVTDTLSRKAINIFHVNKASLIKVYIHPDDNYQHLQNYITEQTNMNCENQIMLFRKKLFTEIAGENTRACGYPLTKEENPLFLFNKENNNILIVPEIDLPKLNEFPSIVAVESDAAQAKTASSLGHLVKRRVEKFSLNCKLIKDAVQCITDYLNDEAKQLHQVTEHLLDKTVLLKKSAEILLMSQQIAKYNNIAVNSGINYPDKIRTVSETFNTETAKSVQELYQKNAKENVLKSEWESFSRSLKCPSETRAPARARTQVEHLRDSWQHLVRDRATRSLSYNDEQFHILERIKITQTINRLKSMLEKEVTPQYTQLAEVLGDWYKISQTYYLKKEILSKDVNKYVHEIQKCEDDLMIENSEYSNQIKVLHQTSKVNTVEKPQNNKNKKAKEELKKTLGKYRAEKGEIDHNLQENLDLLRKMNDILREKITNDESL